jgi:integrase
MDFSLVLHPCDWEVPVLPVLHVAGIPVGILEETILPTTARWWSERAEEFVERKRGEDEVTETWLERVIWDIGRTPSLFARVGITELPSPSDVTVEQIRRLKEGLGWSRSTMASYFSALKPFLRWVGNPVADTKAAWGLPSGDATHRRWLNAEDLAALYNASEGAERVLVSLEGYNGMRRIEARRLRVKDLDLPGNRLRVHGKGRHGGKFRTIPMTGTTYAVMSDWVRGKHPDDHILPGQLRKTASLPLSEQACDSLIRRAAKRAGLTERGVKVSGHDLRRTFGRVAFRSGMSIVDLKNFYGHKDLSMTTHYIGIEEDHMREGLKAFDQVMAPLLSPMPKLPNLA